jgi:hypothetical protein
MEIEEITRVGSGCLNPMSVDFGEWASLCWGQEEITVCMIR